MSHTHRSTSLQGLGTALATLALLIAAGCGETAEPGQVGTTTAPPAPTTGVVTPGAGTPIQPPPEQTAASPVEPPAAATAAADPAPPPIPQQGDAGVHGTVSYRERIALTPGATLTVQLRDTSLMDVASELIAEQDGCYRRGREEVSLDGTTVNMTVTAWVPPPTPWAIDCSDETLELDAIAHIAEPLTSGQPAGDVVVGVAAVIAHITEPFISGQRYTVAVNGQPTTTFAAP